MRRVSSRVWSSSVFPSHHHLRLKDSFRKVTFISGICLFLISCSLITISIIKIVLQIKCSLSWVVLIPHQTTSISHCNWAALVFWETGRDQIIDHYNVRDKKRLSEQNSFIFSSGWVTLGNMAIRSLQLKKKVKQTSCYRVASRVTADQGADVFLLFFCSVALLISI